MIKPLHNVVGACGLLLVLILGSTDPSIARAESFPFQNPNLPIAKRVDDLVSRMSLQEKVAQMEDGAPAIPRLGLPAYEWWSEGLHGLWTTPATVFPEPVGLASTFDLGMETQVADAISDEGRAWYNRALKGAHDPAHAHGLTFYAPNINIFRDPRWGRGQETYGEDPFLTAQFGTVYVKEMLGNDPKYIKLIATPKHYAVHSGPEPERHRFDATPSAYDLNDTYLPAFESTVRIGHAQSVMCAYNSIYGIPCSASPLLVQEKLRKEWGFDGFVISDKGAVRDICISHHYTTTMAEAAADAVKNGCDMTFDDEYNALPEAVQNGFIEEKQIDVSVKRLFTARMKLGMFDPPSMVPYSRIPDSVIDGPAHRKIALQAARESIVLLKNHGEVLPLGAGIHSLAVIGPNADSVMTQGGNYPGTSSKEVSLLEGIRLQAAHRGIGVDYVRGCDWLSGGDTARGTPIPASALSSGGQPGLSGEYFSNVNLEGAAATTHQDAAVNFNWTQTPPQGLNHDNYSVRWTGAITAPKDGAYTLSVTGDDGFRLFVDGQQVIDDWSPHGTETRIATVNFKAGTAVPIRLEYFQGTGDAIVSLGWSPPGEGPFGPAVAAARRADAVIFVGGINSNIEGEEGTGANNGDRPTLDLPAIQEQLLEALTATGKPVVFVLMSGSAMSVNWAQEHVPAILQAWYSGEEGGNAIADVLFGNYNPAGRLSVTFYTGLDQLPDFHDYAMKTRTYRYFEGKPLYRFGYGLSYTKFAYDKLQAPTTAAAGQPVTVEATVKNVGSRAGDEVAELYLRPAPNESVREIYPGQPMPRLILAGFQRINLAPNASKIVKFTLKPQQLLLVNEQGVRDLQPGSWQIFVGGSQPDLSGAAPTAGGGLSSMLTVH